MMVLITTIFGFLGSFLPSIMKYFEERQKLKYNVQLATIQLEATIRNIDAAKEIAKVKEAVEDTNAARDHDADSNGGVFVNFLRASVRPVLTYSVFFLFFGVKLMVAYALFQSGLTIDNVEAATKIILDETTISIITIVIGFYFGSRAMINKDK